MRLPVFQAPFPKSLSWERPKDTDTTPYQAQFHWLMNHQQYFVNTTMDSAVIILFLILHYSKTCLKGHLYYAEAVLKIKISYSKVAFSE